MMNAMCGTDWNDAAFLQNPWLTHANPRVSLVCTAPLEPADNGISLSLPQRGTAYQRRVKPWVDERHDSRVLKERHILVEGGRVTDQRLCAIPSERMNGVPRIPRALLGWYASPRWGGEPFCGSRFQGYTSLVCTAPLGRCASITTTHLHLLPDDRHQPKITGQYPLEHRRPTARGHGCGRLPRKRFMGRGYKQVIKSTEREPLMTILHEHTLYFLKNEPN